MCFTAGIDVRRIGTVRVPTTDGIGGFPIQIAIGTFIHVACGMAIAASADITCSTGFPGTKLFGGTLQHRKSRRALEFQTRLISQTACFEIEVAAGRSSTGNLKGIVFEFMGFWTAEALASIVLLTTILGVLVSAFSSGAIGVKGTVNQCKAIGANVGTASGMRDTARSQIIVRVANAAFAIQKVGIGALFVSRTRTSKGITSGVVFFATRGAIVFRITKDCGTNNRVGIGLEQISIGTNIVRLGTRLVGLTTRIPIQRKITSTSGTHVCGQRRSERITRGALLIGFTSGHLNTTFCNIGATDAGITSSSRTRRLVRISNQLCAILACHGRTHVVVHTTIFIVAITTDRTRTRNRRGVRSQMGSCDANMGRAHGAAAISAAATTAAAAGGNVFVSTRRASTLRIASS